MFKDEILIIQVQNQFQIENNHRKEIKFARFVLLQKYEKLFIMVFFKWTLFKIFEIKSHNLSKAHNCLVKIWKMQII